jgi:drug/metabolite transporter (DMT)-like permease
MVLVVYGFLYYTFAQTTQFIGLIYLNAITFSFILNFSAIVIVFLGWFFLAEKLTKIQWLGVALYILGVAFYFYPFENPSGTLIGYLIAVFHTLANSSGTVIGRYINRSRHLHPLTVSMVSMGIGSTLIFIWALIVDGIPHLSLTSWGIVIWMAIVNTALAFTLWNQTQRTLTATETGIINNLMLIHIVFLAWIFLGERITLIEGIGLVVVVFAIILVQLRNGVISYVEDRC